MRRSLPILFTIVATVGIAFSGQDAVRIPDIAAGNARAGSVRLAPHSGKAIHINARGDAAGWSMTAAGVAHAVVWELGVPRDLGVQVYSDYYIIDFFNYSMSDSGAVAFNGLTPGSQCFFWSGRELSSVGPPAGAGCGTYAVNERGQVVGWAAVGFGRAFVWDRGVTTYIGAPDSDSYAFSVNARGQVLVYSHDLETGALQLFTWERGRVTKIEIPDLYEIDIARINDRGQVAGSFKGRDGADHAFFWEKDVFTDLGPGTVFHAMNDRGQLIGTRREYGGFLWDNGTFTDLGPVTPLGINMRGDVAGVLSAGGGRFHAALWTQGAWVFLETPAGDDSFAVDINERGDIAGWMGSPSTGETRAVVWKNGTFTELAPLDFSEPPKP